MDRLGKYLEHVCRLIASFVLKEAEAYKLDFLEMPMGSIDEDKKSGELEIEQKKAWEDYWMEQLRQ